MKSKVFLILGSISAILMFMTLGSGVEFWLFLIALWISCIAYIVCEDIKFEIDYGKEN